MLQVRLNNFKQGLKALRSNLQPNTSPTRRAQLEEEIKDLSSRIEDIECQIKKNLAET